MSMLRNFPDELNKKLDRRRFLDAELRPTRVEARNADGSVSFRRLDGECIERGANCPVREGQLVERPCRPSFSLQGASGLSMKRAGKTLATLWVESLSPDALPRGFAGIVTVRGRGFKPITVVEFLEFDGETINEDITITSITFVDSGTLQIGVIVAADADLTTITTIDPITDAVTVEQVMFSLAYDNPGQAL